MSADLKIVISAKNLAEKDLAGIKASLGGIGKGAEDAAARSGGLVDGLGRIGLAGLGLGTIAGAARSAADALGFGLNAEMQNTRAQFMAFTKDAGATESILKQVRAEADKTPFSFQAMSAAAAGLGPAAKQANEPLMRLIQDAEILAASNPAQGLEGAAFALREAVSGDFTSIIERFNLPRSYINKLKEEGVPALEIVRRSMQEMGYDLDLVSNLSKTATGRWSTFNDSLDSLKMRLSEPLFTLLSDGLGELQTLLDENKETLNAVASALGEGLKVAITTTADALKGLTAFLREHQEVQVILSAVIGAAAAAWTLQTAATLAHAAATKAVTLATSAQTGVQWLLNAALTANPIGLVVVALAGLAAAFMTAYNNSEDFRLIVDTGLAIVTAAFGAMWQTAGTVLDNLGRAIDGVLGPVRALLDAVGRIPSSIPNPFGGGGGGGGGTGDAAGREAAWILAGRPDYNNPGYDVAGNPLPGFQHGGSFLVRGRGGADSEVVTFRATPGERVDVIPPGQASGIDYDRLAAAMATRPMVLTMNGREVARIVREELLRQKFSMTSLGLS